MIQSIEKLRLELLNKFDVVLSISIILLGLIIIIASSIFNLNREYLGYASVIAALVYLYYKRRGISGKFSLNLSDSQQNNFFKITIILFIFSFICSILLLQSELYHRPALYFVFITLSAAIILSQILFLNTQKKYCTPIILIEILLLSVSLRASIYYEFPGIYGFDPNFHYSLAENIVANGHTPKGVEYASFPAIHFLSAITFFLSGLSFKNSFFILGIIEVFGSVFIFYVGKFIFNEKIGLISVLILNFANYNILWGYWLTPMALATLIMSMVLYVLFKMNTGKKKASLSIILLILLVLSVVNHSLSTFALFVILISFLGAEIFYSVIKNENFEYKTISLTLILFFAVLFLIYWIYAYYQPVDFFTLMVNSLKNSLIKSNIGDVSVVSTAAELNYFSLILMEVGFSIFLFLLIIGLLKSFSKKFINRNIFILLGPIVTIFFIIYAVSVAGINILLPERWFTYLYCISAFFVAIGTLEIVKGFNAVTKKNIAAILIVSIMIFFMITTPTASNTDSPIYAKENTQRNGATSSELNALNFLKENCYGNFSMNSAYGVFLNPLGREIKNKKNLDPRDNLTYRNSIIILRSIDIEEGVYIPFPKKKINEIIIPSKDFLNILDQKRSLIYSNSKVKMYI